MAASLLIGCINIVAGGDVIHIGGKVLCQDCTQGWNEWINGKPLKGNTNQLLTNKYFKIEIACFLIMLMEALDLRL